SAARVAGEPDAEWGSIVVARVVADGLQSSDVIEAVRERLAPHEVPKRVEIVEQLGGSWKDD
ncbi:MAG: long-chain fatty acid--CoA ligase, partial [Actinobacteria bacterium]|nr:long-chain fatty acid--CoA ligase [Actinomycetota bacterium]NIS36125.1 long-chain fatty acid--CoA ligase [Actinomycetota bacterium]NIU22172.1 long-chain fatty acid--CoA ligase [Actinomycetota bacterium]NIU70699.1 long-chain fatty acid--CoA ligase [Actinomycetota bacterium]NIW32604.1 hypothetical protein [Actinomycetota bacterium]